MFQTPSNISPDSGTNLKVFVLREELERFSHITRGDKNKSAN